MTFGRVLRGVTLHEGARISLTGSAGSRHLHDHLNPAFVGHSVGKQFAYRSGDRILFGIAQRDHLRRPPRATLVVARSIAVPVAIPIPIAYASV